MNLNTFLANCSNKTLMTEIDNCLSHLKKFKNKKDLNNFWLGRLSILNEEVKTRENWRPC